MAMNNQAYMAPNPQTPCIPVKIYPELCTGCNICADQCRMDVMVHNPEKGGPPIVLYPDECWFCGTCVEDCPFPGAITMQHPLNQRVGWKRKETGEYFRIGMKNPPPPYKKPPVG
jgi:NAD-dependent dihydropyrimidine dehydrogenase PreA subunit